MPRRRTPTRDQLRETLQKQPKIDQESGDELVPDGEEEAIERIQAALSDGSGSNVWLIRVNELFRTPQGIKEGWAFNADIEEIEILRERIAQECGPGSYRCRVLRDGFPFKQYDLEIRMTAAQRRAAQNPAAAPAPAAPISADGLSPALARILENQQRALDQQAQMLQAIIARPNGPTMQDMLAQMKMMQDLMPKAPAPETGFDMFIKALDLVEKLKGESGDGRTGSTLTDLARDVLPKLLEKLPTQPATIPPARLAVAPPAAPMMQPPAAPAPAVPNQAAQLAQIDELKKWLLAKAQAGEDPAQCADYAADNMPAELWEALGQVPEPMALLLQVFPEAAAHRTWFEKLVAEFFVDEEPSADLNGQGHDVAAAVPAH